MRTELGNGGIVSNGKRKYFDLCNVCVFLCGNVV